MAEFELSSPLLREATTAVPDMTIRGEEIFIQAGGNPKYLFWAEGGPFDAFESALGRDPSIEEYAVLTTICDNRYYRVTFTDEYVQYLSYDVASTHDIAYVDTTVQDGTAHIQVRSPSRSAFRSYRQFHEENDVPFDLIRLYEEQTVEPVDEVATRDQREALVLAYERGYYDSPRETTLEAIAADLDITRQAVADRLKRGTKRLIACTLR